MAKGSLQIKYEKLVMNNLELQEQIKGLETGINRALERYYKADKQTNGGFVRGSVAWAMEDDLKQTRKGK